MWRFKLFILYLLISEPYVHAGFKIFRKSADGEEKSKSESQKKIAPYRYDRFYNQQSSVMVPYPKERKKRQTLSEDPCYKKGLCENNKDENTLVCYCDDNCRYFKDCCYDAQIISNPVVQLPNFGLMKCEPYRHKFSLVVYSWMVIGCPLQYKNQVVRNHCNSREKNFINKVPVHGKNGIMYANAYCAICNNVTDYVTSAVAYNKRFCEEDFNFNTECANKLYRFEPPNGFNLRYCLREYATNNSMNDKCTYYQNPIYHASSLFKNHFCSIGENTDIKHRCVDKIKTEDTLPTQQYTLFPLTILFSFSKPGIVEDRTFCEAEDNFDSDINACSSSECVNGLCPGKKLISNQHLYYQFSFQSSHDQDYESIYRLSLSLFFSFSTQIYKIYPLIVSLLTNETAMTGSLLIDIVVSNYFYVNDIRFQSINRTLSNLSITYIEEDKSKGNLTEVKITPFMKNATRLRGWKRGMMEYQVKSENFFSLYKNTRHFNENGTELCSNMLIKGSLMNSTLQHTSNTSDLPTASFRLGNNIFEITTWECMNSSNVVLTKGETLKNTLLEFETILTYGCMSVSCIALAVAIIIYKYFLFSDSIPGSNTFNLLINMLLSHMLFMVGIGANDNQLVCKILGIAIHYFWISSFSFMSIAVIHVAVKLAKMLKTPNVSHTAKITLKWKLTGLGYTLALLIVIPSVLIDTLDSIPFSVGYNGAICFPTDYPATIFFVSGPIVLSLVINLVSFFVAICSICKQSTSSKMLDKKYFSYLLVYFRLALLSGMLWIFGVFSQLFPSPVLDTIFIVLVGLQGFFISISTLCTKTVCKSFPCASKLTTGKLEIQNPNGVE